MKKNQLLVLLLLCTTALFADTDFRKLSIEASTGYSIPTIAYQTRYQSNFRTFENKKLAIRYMFNPKAGLRLEYVSDKFQNKPNGFKGCTMKRYGAEFIANLSEYVPKLNFSPKLNFLGHAGLGYSTLLSFQEIDRERIGSITLGISPMYKLSSNFSVFADYTFVLNTYQHHFYTGNVVNEQYIPIVGAHSNLTLGVSYSFLK
jgi:OOP family OmpA-OmpF porin